MVSTAAHNYYVWDKGEDGYYKFTFGPMYMTWYMEIKQVGDIIKVKDEGYGWITGTHLFFLGIPTRMKFFIKRMEETDGIS